MSGYPVTRPLAAEPGTVEPGMSPQDAQSKHRYLRFILLFVPNWLPKLMTVVGVVCVGIGVSWGFADASTHFQFEVVTDYAGLFLITLPVGIVLSAGGTILWARRFNERKRLKVAGLIFVLGMFVLMIVPNNVHGPGMLLGLTDICALILSFVLAVMAFAGREPSNGSNSAPEERK